ncbi:hypothetical protein BC937DRAFT_90822 [Endogone sp. FLAS-F59071]|nr:hypothetical protein BC937DRAFT_90822 [Endogone sp. FLAS-F59071]|eukprot:RUS16775.1 hypothetical protein BC937DRAFT_90822 [Endogone sp. FLAS-F59071]
MDHDIWNANRLFSTNESFHSTALIPLASPPPTVTTFGEAQSPPPSPPPSTMPSKASPTSATSYAAAIVSAGGPRIDTASPPLSPNSSANLRSTSEALVKKLLQLDSPRLDPKIVDVLLLDGQHQLTCYHHTVAPLLSLLFLFLSLLPSLHLPSLSLCPLAL